MDKIYIFFTTLDESDHIIRPKYSMNFFHSIILTVKIGSGFPYFRKIILEVSKKYSAVIVSNHKDIRCSPLYPQVYCTITSWSCQHFGKIPKVHFELHRTQDVIKNIYLCPPFNLTYLGSYSIQYRKGSANLQQMGKQWGWKLGVMLQKVARIIWYEYRVLGSEAYLIPI